MTPREIDEAYAHAVENDVWPEGFSPFNAIRDLLGRYFWGIPESREGMVMVFRHDGSYAGCMGEETWQNIIGT